MTTARKTAKKKTATRKTKKVPTTSQVTAPKKPATAARTTRSRKASTAAKGTRKNKASAIELREEHYKLIEQTAYFLAEKNGFQGDPQAYWVRAEAEVTDRLAKA